MILNATEDLKAGQLTIPKMEEKLLRAMNDAQDYLYSRFENLVVSLHKKQMDLIEKGIVVSLYGEAVNVSFKLIIEWPM